MMRANAPSTCSRAAALRAFLCAIKGGLGQHSGTLFDLGYDVNGFFAGVVDGTVVPVGL